MNTKAKDSTKLCACGCGGYVSVKEESAGKDYKHGHRNRGGGAAKLGAKAPRQREASLNLTLEFARRSVTAVDVTIERILAQIAELQVQLSAEREHQRVLRRILNELDEPKEAAIFDEVDHPAAEPVAA